MERPHKKHISLCPTLVNLVLAKTSSKGTHTLQLLSLDTGNGGGACTVEACAVIGVVDGGLELLEDVASGSPDHDGL